MILYPKEKMAFDWNLISPKSDLIIILKNQSDFSRLKRQTQKLSCFVLLSWLKPALCLKQTSILAFDLFLFHF